MPKPIAVLMLRTKRVATFFAEACSRLLALGARLTAHGFVLLAVVRAELQVALLTGFGNARAGDASAVRFSVGWSAINAGQLAALLAFDDQHACLAAGRTRLPANVVGQVAIFAVLLPTRVAFRGGCIRPAAGKIALGHRLPGGGSLRYQIVPGRYFFSNEGVAQQFNGGLYANFGRARRVAQRRFDPGVPVKLGMNDEARGC
ncbi:MAG TPA: hypothetical protein VE621_04405 [Bryobacteraceae bacterium]|jgi:hypothetical protein|nr:hypothetical protein [Bryobacteraceae bacterium]